MYYVTTKVSLVIDFYAPKASKTAFNEHDRKGLEPQWTYNNTWWILWAHNGLVHVIGHRRYFFTSLLTYKNVQIVQRVDLHANWKQRPLRLRRQNWRDNECYECLYQIMYIYIIFMGIIIFSSWDPVHTIFYNLEISKTLTTSELIQVKCLGGFLLQLFNPNIVSS